MTVNNNYTKHLDLGDHKSLYLYNLAEIRYGIKTTIEVEGLVCGSCHYLIPLSAIPRPCQHIAAIGYIPLLHSGHCHPAGLCQGTRDRAGLSHPTGT